MTETGHVIASDLTEALHLVEVAGDGLRAVVGTHELTAESPRELRRQLSTTLYEVLHTGREPERGEPPRTLRDAELEARFGRAVPHRNTRARATLLQVTADGSYVVKHEGLRLKVPAAALAGDPDSSEGTRVDLVLPAARPALSAGFFLADGSRGAGYARPVLRMYVHVEDVDAAVAAWSRILSALEGAEAPYRAKVLSTRRLLPRRDALVVYLGPGAWHAVPVVAEAVKGLPGVGADSSPITRRLAPGVGLAWEPQDGRPGMRGLSFGEHRTRVLAEALVGHALTGGGSSRDELIATRFVEANIDPADPSRNIDSPILGENVLTG
ncbi:T3SS effector HopA1 family protein [Kitasatospora sp. NPDC101155]|uniref:T3SS effector HopA1 family protein n=1 Tax=Kitasatospora sp. NPDC101155 TaxID=3364097 RepID=UPI003817CFF4